MHRIRYRIFTLPTELAVLALLGVSPAQAQTPSLLQKVDTVLCAVRSTDDRPYWVARITEDPNGQGSAWAYWVHRMEIGDGVGRAAPCGVPPPDPALPTPAPSVDYSPLLQQILTSQQLLIEATTELLVVSKNTNEHVINIDRTFAQTMGAVSKFASKYIAPAIVAFVAAKKF